MWSALFLIVGKIFHFTMTFDVSYRFFVDILYGIKKVPSYPGLLRVFIMNSVEFCQRLFLNLLRSSYRFSSLVCQDGKLTLVDFWTLYQPCIPRITPFSFWYVNLLCITGSDWLIFGWEFLIHPHSWHEEYWSMVLLSCNVFVWFWYQGDAGLIKSGSKLGRVPSSVFLKP